jgi:hypothetical protein
VNTGQDGENDPNRALASVLADPSAREPQSRLPASSGTLPAPALAWIGDVSPVRERKLYFSERRADPQNPNSQIQFFITVDGQEPSVFDPYSATPNIVVKQGDVEDWIIENRSLELHDFHIHQLHFQLREWYGYAVDEPFLRDTVSVPFFDNHMQKYPSVRLRMDFRDPNIVGTFVYHCHLLEHEDGGMMGTIRVDPADPAPDARTPVSAIETLEIVTRNPACSAYEKSYWYTSDNDGRAGGLRGSPVRDPRADHYSRARGDAGVGRSGGLHAGRQSRPAITPRRGHERDLAQTGG